jgi:hypothetical protein
MTNEKIDELRIQIDKEKKEVIKMHQLRFSADGFFTTAPRLNAADELLLHNTQNPTTLNVENSETFTQEGPLSKISDKLDRIVEFDKIVDREYHNELRQMPTEDDAVINACGENIKMRFMRGELPNECMRNGERIIDQTRYRAHEIKRE